MGYNKIGESLYIKSKLLSNPYLYVSSLNVWLNQYISLVLIHSFQWIFGSYTILFGNKQC